MGLGRIALGIGTMGGSELVSGGFLPAKTRAKIPIVNALWGDKTDEQKNLERTQEQIAKEVAAREKLVQQRALTQQTQRLTAFGPMNQYLASSLGPEAAFRPEMMADFAKDPMGGPQLDPSLIDYRGTDPNKRKQVEDFLRAKREEAAREEQRRQQLTAAFTLAPGSGPKPIQMPRAAPPRPQVRGR